MVKQVLTALTAVAGIALWVGQPAQARDWPSGYDPASGLTWEQDFTYEDPRWQSRKRDRALRSRFCFSPVNFNNPRYLR